MQEKQQAYGNSLVVNENGMFLNGAELATCSGLSVEFPISGNPVVTLKIDVANLDVDFSKWPWLAEKCRKIRYEVEDG